ncbi:MAG: diaminopimelate decarboxylase [Alphaproteobacteria bacterium]|nr:diaminopimelate decarboxylase [Alphaproteobacteria bacterium]
MIAMATGREALARLRVLGDRLDVTPDGVLCVDGHSTRELIERFGSPLVVVAEATLRENYRRIRGAFAARWPAPVNVMYAIKTNNTLAIRAVLSEEGAGGDCFGLGELHATMVGGTDPARVVMNGSNKSRAEIAEAVRLGITINIDGEAEIGWAEAEALAQGRPARVALRLKLMPEGLDRFSAAFFKTKDGVRESVRRSKWGYAPEAAVPLLQAMTARPALRFVGYSCHVGRFAADPEAYGVVAGAIADAVITLHARTGAWPAQLDVGGGWARQREPESRAPELNRFTIEDHAEATCDALLTALRSTGRPMPELWLEPGRYIVGNAVLLLARVGAIKLDVGMTWVHLDASTNDLMRIETSQAWYHVLPASRMDAPGSEVVDLVGSTCIPSLIGASRSMPALQSGDVVAILDAGMYAEAISNQFNAIPRPASVLVGDGTVELIKRRETIDDVFATHTLPPRLAASAKRSIHD